MYSFVLLKKPEYGTVYTLRFFYFLFLAASMTPIAPILQLSDFGIGYKGCALVPPFSFEVKRGEFWAIIGPNGAGKTTFLRSILGLLPPVQGHTQWTPAPPRIGYVPQRSTIDDTIPSRVIDLVALGADHHYSIFNPLYLRTRRKQILEAIAHTQLDDLLYAPFSTLSEGQRQRVLIARALASDPAILFLDEPTSAMDLNAERSTLEVLRNLLEHRSIALMMVSHHVAEVAKQATHLLLIDRDTQTLLHGPVEDVAYRSETTRLFGSLLQPEEATNPREDVRS